MGNRELRSFVTSVRHYWYGMPRKEFDAMITEAYDNDDFLPLDGHQMTVVNESRARIMAEQGGLATLQDRSNGSNPAAY